MQAGGKGKQHHGGDGQGGLRERFCQPAKILCLSGTVGVI